MSKQNRMHESKQKQPMGKSSMEIEVQIRQPRTDCPIYEWDRRSSERGLPVRWAIRPRQAERRDLCHQMAGCLLPLRW